MSDGWSLEGYREGVDQVFVLRSPLPLPTSFAVHTWLLTSGAGGELDRWEIWQFAEVGDPCWGHLHRNLMDPRDGMRLVWGVPGRRWTGEQVLTVSEGASGIISFLSDRPGEYPFTDEYHILGPNSNTFPQWLLDRFVPRDVELSWRAVGRDAARSDG